MYFFYSKKVFFSFQLQTIDRKCILLVIQNRNSSNSNVEAEI